MLGSVRLTANHTPPHVVHLLTEVHGIRAYHLPDFRGCGLTAPGYFPSCHYTELQVQAVSSKIRPLTTNTCRTYAVCFLLNNPARVRHCNQQHFGLSTVKLGTTTFLLSLMTNKSVILCYKPFSRILVQQQELTYPADTP